MTNIDHVDIFCYPGVTLCFWFSLAVKGFALATCNGFVWQLLNV